MVFKDILFDAKKLAKDIGPASWGQGFSNGRGAGISLARLIELMKDAKVQPDPREGYTQETSTEIFFDLVRLTLTKNPLINSPPKVREVMASTYEENASHFGTGEKALIKALWDIEGDADKFKFYLLFQDKLDPLLEHMMIVPKDERPKPKKKTTKPKTKG